MTSVKSDGESLEYSRELHILSVSPSSPLAAGESDSLVIEYTGKINEDACFVEVDEEKRAEQLRLVLYNIGKRYAFVEPGYVLLTPESHWYPVAGIPYGAAYPKTGKIDFVDFGLTVKTESGLTAISQGEVEAAAGRHGRVARKDDAPGVWAVGIGGGAARAPQLSHAHGL